MMKIENGNIVIDLLDLLTNYNGKSKQEFLEIISCDDSVIKYVTQQIIDKWTESGFFGVISDGNYLSGLDWAWREIAKHSSIIAKEEIEKLERLVKKQNAELFKLHNENRNQNY